MTDAQVKAMRLDATRARRRLDIFGTTQETEHLFYQLCLHVEALADEREALLSWVDKELSKKWDSSSPRTHGFITALTLLRQKILEMRK